MEIESCNLCIRAIAGHGAMTAAAESERQQIQTQMENAPFTDADVGKTLSIKANKVTVKGVTHWHVRWRWGIMEDAHCSGKIMRAEGFAGVQYGV